MKTTSQLQPLVQEILSELTEAFSGCNFAFNCAYRHDILAFFTEWTWYSTKQMDEDHPEVDFSEALEAYLKAGLILDNTKEVWSEQHYGEGTGKAVLDMIAQRTDNLGEADWMFREVVQRVCLSLYKGLKSFGEDKDPEGQALFNDLADQYRKFNNQLAKAIDLELAVANA